MEVCLGLGAFALFCISDYNDWKKGLRVLRFCFPLGALLLASGTVLAMREGTPLVRGWPRAAVLLLGAAFFGLLLYTLFFALPMEVSYTAPGKKRPACTTGIYALCRHPGVLWFAGLYGCLWAGGGLPLWEAALYSGLNVLLVLFEDVCVFPAVLEGYDAYRRSTPFLLPTRRSIRACRSESWG